MKLLHALTLFLAGEVMAAPIVLPLFTKWNIHIPGVGSKESQNTENSDQSSVIHEKRDMSPGAKAGIIIGAFLFLSLGNFGPDILGKLVGNGPIVGGIEKRDLDHHENKSDFGDTPGTNLHKNEKRKFCDYEQYYDIDSYGDCIIPHHHKDMSDFRDIPGTDLHKNKKRNSHLYQDELENSYESPRTDLHKEESTSPDNHHMIVDDFYDTWQPTDVHELEKRVMDGRTKTGIVLGVVGGLIAFPIIHEIVSYALNVPFAPASPLGFVEGIPAKRDTTDGQEDQDKANTESDPIQIHWNRKRMDWKAKAGIAGGVIGFFLTIGYGADLIGHLFNPFRGAMDVLEVPWGMGKRDINEIEDDCVYRRSPYTEDHSPKLECMKHQLEQLAKRGHKKLSTAAILGITVAGLFATWAPLIINRVGFNIGLFDEPLFKRDNNDTTITGNGIQLVKRQLVTLLDITDRPEAPEEFVETVVSLGEGLTVEDAEALWNYTSTIVNDGAKSLQKRLEI